MNIHSLPVVVSGTASPASERAKRPPDERLTDNCGGKTRVDGSTAGPTGIRVVGGGGAHFLAGFIAAARKLFVACSNLQLQKF